MSERDKNPPPAERPPIKDEQINTIPVKVEAEK